MSVAAATPHANTFPRIGSKGSLTMATKGHAPTEDADRAAVVLLHGWPQTSHAWRAVVPFLVGKYEVMTPDLPGVGRAAPASHGYDKRSMAADLRTRVVDGSGPVVLVGHDMGALVAYAYAQTFPEDVLGLMLVDYPVPGVAGWEEMLAGGSSWHFGFHREAEIAAALVAGREAQYFRHHIDRFAGRPGLVGDEDVAAYVDGYRGSERLTAGFSMFRALILDGQSNADSAGGLDVPVHLAFGELSYATLADTTTRGLIDIGVPRVTSSIIPGCGHWPAEEKPALLAAAIADLVESVLLSR
jgi:pimeloyl-ACP methyl ester carboxylesterase